MQNGMKLTTTIQVSVDGVMQGNGGLHEIDRRRGFERGRWPGRCSASPIAAALNTRPKYVASTTLTSPRWADTTVLPGEVLVCPVVVG
jgi:hypothetical protein